MGALALLAPAFMPAIADGVRGLFAKFTGGAGGTPQNVDERIKLMEAETERLKALAQIDTPAGVPSLWVTNLRAAFRYVAISGIWILTGIAVVKYPALAVTATLLDISGATMSFVIGERMYLRLKQ